MITRINKEGTLSAALLLINIIITTTSLYLFILCGAILSYVSKYEVQNNVKIPFSSYTDHIHVVSVIISTFNLAASIILYKRIQRFTSLRLIAVVWATIVTMVCLSFNY